LLEERGYFKFKAQEMASLYFYNLRKTQSVFLLNLLDDYKSKWFNEVVKINK